MTRCPDFSNGVYDPKPSKVTISNAMDGDQVTHSIQEMYHNFGTIQRTFLLILPDEETTECRKLFAQRM
jgi:hypothetical protein